MFQKLKNIVSYLKNSLGYDNTGSYGNVTEQKIPLTTDNKFS